MAPSPRLGGHPNINPDELRKEVVATQEVVEVSPTAPECVGIWIAVHYGEFIQARYDPEVLECILPKSVVCLLGQWSNRKGLQGPPPCSRAEKGLNAGRENLATRPLKVRF